MQKPPSAPTSQVKANRLLVQQKEEAQERVKQQGKTTRSECGHSSPSYLSLWRQAVTLASPLSGHGQKTTAKDGCDDGLSARERLAPVAIDTAAMLSARERLTPVAVIGTDDRTDDGTDDDGWRDDGMNGWKGRPDTTTSGQNQGYYISRCKDYPIWKLGEFGKLKKFHSLISSHQPTM
jgi:hypothetical protein